MKYEILPFTSGNVESQRIFTLLFKFVCDSFGLFLVFVSKTKIQALIYYLPKMIKIGLSIIVQHSIILESIEGWPLRDDEVLRFCYQSLKLERTRLQASNLIVAVVTKLTL